jgi:plastocyanin domain-containing protein
MKFNSKIFLSIVAMLLLIGLALVITNKPNTSTYQNQQKVEVIDGIQYITINAGGGYFPRVTQAEAGIPTKLVVKTNGVFDCSAALTIRSINYQKVLPQTGEEVIDIGTPVAGVPFTGTCSMGMYSFVINFS